MAAEPKYKKMYKNSPTLETDEEGNKYIKKSKPEEATEGEPDAMPLENKAMYERHIKEVGDMHDRHLAERKDITKRHMKEMQKNVPTDEPTTEGEK